MMETATMTNRSGPSSRNTSHNRRWVWYGTEFAKSVMYHFVAYDVVDTMCVLKAA